MNEEHDEAIERLRTALALVRCHRAQDGEGFRQLLAGTPEEDRVALVITLAGMPEAILEAVNEGVRVRTGQQLVDVDAVLAEMATALVGGVP